MLLRPTWPKLKSRAGDFLLAFMLLGKGAHAHTKAAKQKHKRKQAETSCKRLLQQQRTSRNARQEKANTQEKASRNTKQKEQSEAWQTANELLPQRVCCPWLCAMPVQHLQAPEQAREDTAPRKIDVTSNPPVGGISVVTLIRTDTTLDHSQKAEKV